MNFELRVQSTMLPQTVSFIVNSESEDDDLDTQLDELEKFIASNDASAEFRVEVLESDDDAIRWLAKELTETHMPAFEIVKLLVKEQEADILSDGRAVMLVVYAQMYGGNTTADRLVDAVAEGCYHVDYHSDLGEVYSDFGRSYYEADESDMDLAGNEDYFDWRAYGESVADGVIQYSDGDWYVWKEWT